MKSNLTLAIIGFMAIMLLASPAVYSDDDDSTSPNGLPSYYPADFQKRGVLTKIRSQYHWEVNGIQIRVSSNVLVHSLASNFSSLYYINQGMELGYRKDSSGEITEVWELPNGTVDGE